MDLNHCRFYPSLVFKTSALPDSANLPKKFTVPTVGFEPTRLLHPLGLSQLCLPITSRGQLVLMAGIEPAEQVGLNYSGIPIPVT